MIHPPMRPSWALISVLGLTNALSFPLLPESRDVKDLGSVLGSKGNLSTYYGLIKKYPDILLQLPNSAGVTIVAPSNEAFSKAQGWNSDNQTLVTNMLLYHILQGTLNIASIPEGPADFATTLLKDKAFTNVTAGQKVIVYKQPEDTFVFASGSGSRSTIVEADIAFTGGTVQMVDTLLVPPARLESTARDSYKDLSAFLGALYSAGLVPQFAESPNVTIFAPRNAAFQRVAGSLTGLDKKALARVLQYHIVPGQLLPSTQLANNSNFTSAADGPATLHLTKAGNNVFVESAQLVQPDILIANGVVHMIDGVLNPDAAGSRPDLALGTQAPVFPATGATSMGKTAPTPFIDSLPCTVDCPVTTSADATVARTSGTVRSTGTSQGGAARPRCTGLSGGGIGMGVGVVGAGVVGVAGMVGIV